MSYAFSVNKYIPPYEERRSPYNFTPNSYDISIYRNGLMVSFIEVRMNANGEDIMFPDASIDDSKITIAQRDAIKACITAYNLFGRRVRIPEKNNEV